MPSTRTPHLRVVGAVLVGNGTWPTRYIRSVGKARRVMRNITARSTALGAPFTPTVAPVLSDGTTVGAAAAAAKTFLQSQKIKQLRGNRVDALIGKLMRT